MSKVKKTSMIAVIMVATIAVGILWCVFFKENIAPDSPSYDVNMVMKDNIEITIGEIKDPTVSVSTAEVTIAAPDLVAIYRKMTENNQIDGLKTEDICSVVSRYAKYSECIVKHNITTEVRKVGDKWILVSDECVQDIIADAAEQLFAQILQNKETFEIETIDIGGLAK